MASASTAAADDAAEKLICVLGDGDTVTGFLLAGVGQRDAKGANFLVVDASASEQRTPARSKEPRGALLARRRR